MRRTRTLRGFAPWLALLAMGLLIFAPTVSRSLEAFRAPALASAHYHEQMMMGMPRHSAQHDHRGSQDPTDVCGYCSLMHDSPVLLLAVAAFLPTVPAAPPATPCPLPFPPHLRPLDLCPRGPPLA